MTRITYPEGRPRRRKAAPHDHDWTMALHWDTREGHGDSYTKRWDRCRICGAAYVEPPYLPPELHIHKFVCRCGATA